ncbi:MULTISPECIES: hypothetical protein [Pandoraea]|uniref:Uncharacterized protein n=1 Tax=Pandoraea communis TaxID=2508297 RepID=A0A5E4XX57_9BURK|nr:MULTISPECIES: hypothetical protein [Pandoraea]ALS66592.1 hypothetical protein AT395_17825 [Pandoraea apista]CFB61435.1 hypothetical protein LMG16407_01494 [Pandoraea apista]VVE40956.1 hypothetical protein PCO31110_04204 [Pandoraea communis]
MSILKRIFGSGMENPRTLAALKRRAKEGARITLLATQLKGSDMPLPDELQGVERVITRVFPDRVLFNPNGPGGEQRADFRWPSEPRDGFAGMIIDPNGVFVGFVDDSTFIVDTIISYSIYRIDD